MTTGADETGMPGRQVLGYAEVEPRRWRRRVVPVVVLACVSMVLGWFYTDLVTRAKTQYLTVQRHYLEKELLATPLPAARTFPTWSDTPLLPIDHVYRRYVDIGMTIESPHYWPTISPFALKSYASPLLYFGSIRSPEKLAVVELTQGGMEVSVIKRSGLLSSTMAFDDRLNLRVQRSFFGEAGTIGAGKQSATDPSTIEFPYALGHRNGVIRLTVDERGKVKVGGTLWYDAKLRKIYLAGEKVKLATLGARPTMRRVVADSRWIAALPDGRLASGSNTETFVESGETGASFTAKHDRSEKRDHFALSADNTLLVTQDGAGLEVLDLSNGQVLEKSNATLADKTATLFRKRNVYTAGGGTFRQLYPRASESDRSIDFDADNLPTMSDSGVVARILNIKSSEIRISHLNYVLKQRDVGDFWSSYLSTSMISPNGGYLAVGNKFGQLFLYDLKKDGVRLSLEIPRSLEDGRWSPDSRFLAVPGVAMVILIDVKKSVAYWVGIPHSLEARAAGVTFGQGKLLIAPALSETAFEVSLPP